MWLHVINRLPHVTKLLDSRHYLLLCSKICNSQLYIIHDGNRHDTYSELINGYFTSLSHISSSELFSPQQIWRWRDCDSDQRWSPGAAFSYKLRYIVGFWLVEMAISTNQKPTIYRNLYENTGPVNHNHTDSHQLKTYSHIPGTARAIMVFETPVRYM